MRVRLDSNNEKVPERMNLMRIICLDDHSIMLDNLVRELNILAPTASISAFQDAQTTIEFAQENGCDIFFCEIDLRGMTALWWLRRCRKLILA